MLPKSEPWKEPAIPRLREQVSMARRIAPSRTLMEMARGRLSGPPVPAADSVEWLARYLVQRIEDRWDAVCVWTGEEGSAKSTGILRTIDATDRLLTARGLGSPFSFDNIDYTARSLLRSYQRGLPFGQVWFDESQRGLLAGDTFSAEQEVLINLLGMARVRGQILHLAIPDIWLLAKKVRGRRAVLWVHLQKRGTPSRPAPTRGIIHERDRRLWYKPTQNLRLVPSLVCPEIEFQPYADNDPRWVQYLGVKDRNLREWEEEAHLRLDRAEKKLFGATLAEAKIQRGGH